MRITSKGQVTIPQDIREKFGLLPNTEVEFKVARGKVYLETSEADPRNRARRALEKLRGSANEPMFKGWTTDKIMALTRGED